MDQIIGAVQSMSRAELTEVERAVARRRAQLEGEGDAEPGSTRVVEYRPYADGMLQAEERAYTRKDGSRTWRGPYWTFTYHSRGRRRRVYIGKTDRPEAVLESHKREIKQVERPLDEREKIEKIRREIAPAEKVAREKEKIEKARRPVTQVVRQIEDINRALPRL